MVSDMAKAQYKDYADLAVIRNQLFFAGTFKGMPLDNKLVALAVVYNEYKKTHDTIQAIEAVLMDEHGFTREDLDKMYMEVRKNDGQDQ